MLCRHNIIMAPFVQYIYMYINRKSTVHMYMYMYIDFHKQLESRNEGPQCHYKNSCFREDISYVHVYAL